VGRQPWLALGGLRWPRARRYAQKAAGNRISVISVTSAQVSSSPKVTTAHVPSRATRSAVFTRAQGDGWFSLDGHPAGATTRPTSASRTSPRQPPSGRSRACSRLAHSESSQPRRARPAGGMGAPRLTYGEVGSASRSASALRSRPRRCARRPRPGWGDRWTRRWSRREPRRAGPLGKRPPTSGRARW
jgi:hypothetical protein